MEVSRMDSESKRLMMQQMLAFRLLATNQPVPEILLRPIRDSLRATPIVNAAHPAAAAAAAADDDDDADVAALPGVRVQVDAEAPQREHRLLAAVQARFEELNQLRHLMPAYMDRSLHREFFELRLLPFQRALRSSISAQMRELALAQAAENPASFRRPARLPVLGASDYAVAGSPGAIAVGAAADASSGATSRRSFVEAVLQHVDVFRRFHSLMRQRMRKSARGAVAHFNNLQRKQQQQQERVQRERLRALKANDEEGYMKLLLETKNERLTMLIQQTDKYLERIRELVAAHQHEEEAVDEESGAVVDDAAAVAAAAPNADLELEDVTDNASDANHAAKAAPAAAGVGAGSAAVAVGVASAAAGGEKKQIYNSAHRVEEEVEQPTMMKFGILKPYQVEGLKWLVSLYNNNLNGILADEMGLGKTIQSIALVTYLHERKGVRGPFLVTTPLSTMENWRLEFARWAPDIKLVVYNGPPQTRKQLYSEFIATGQFNVVLTTYDYVIKDKGPLGKIRWSFLIVDEGHRLKNHASKLHVVFSKHFHTRNRLLLTGTPLQNNLSELWSLLNFLLPTIFNSVQNFEEWFNAPFENIGDSVAMTEEEALLIINRLHKVLRPFLLRRVKKQVEHQLPPKVEKIVKCAPSALQEVMYKRLREEGAVLVEDIESGEPRTASRSVMNALMQLRKVCNHPYLFYDEYCVDEKLVRVSGKFDLLDHVLPKMFATGHRVLMFSQFTSTMSILEDFLRLRDYPYLRLDGSTKSEDRGELLRLFNAPDSEYNIFILSTRAGGLGLNLQTADTVILFDSDWNPHMDMQAQDRAHRIGQKNTVLVLRLVMVDSVEEKILERAEYKMGIDAKVIEAGMFDRSSTATKRRSMLCELLKTDRNAKAARHLAPLDDEINRMIARKDGELEIFQRMDRERQEQWLSAGHSGARPRLVTESELPRHLLEPPPPRAAPDDPMSAEMGRGMRVRKEVVYSDRVSEAEFMKAITYSDDDGSDSDRVGAVPDGQKKGRGRPQKRRRLDEDEMDDEMAEDFEQPVVDDDDGDDYEATRVGAGSANAARSRPRGVGGAASAKSAARRRHAVAAAATGSGDDGEAEVVSPEDADGSAAPRLRIRFLLNTAPTSAESPSPPSRGAKRARDAADAADSGDRAALVAILDALMRECDGEGRRRADMFMVLPPRRQYPDYYRIIAKPIDLRTISSQLRSPRPYGRAELSRDVELLFRNATTYNEEGSQIYDDAQFLLNLFRRLVGGELN